MKPKSKQELINSHQSKTICKDCGNACDLAFTDGYCCECFNKETYSDMEWCNVCIYRVTQAEQKRSKLEKNVYPLTQFIKSDLS